jgi:hypothetical protein
VPAVNFDFLNRRSAERFAELLDETTGSRRHHSRGPADEQLAELVAIGSSLPTSLPGAGVDPEFRTGLRAMLVATAERDGIGRTAAAETEPAAPARARLKSGLLGREGRRFRTRGAIVIGVAAGAVAVSGISAASESASPGDTLYGVKRSTERAQLAMAGSDVNRGQLSLNFARTRLAEAAAMKGDDAGFGGVLNDMDADTRKGVKLLTTSSVARRDTKPLGTVDDFVTEQRQKLMPVLDRVGPDNRERAMTSLDLLDSVRERTEDLRTGLDCTPVEPAGADTLGPKLRDCVANADNPTTSKPSGHGSKVTTKPTKDKDATARPSRRTTTVEPDASPSSTEDPSGTGAPGPDLAPFGGTSPSETPSTGPQDRSDPVGGLLGGLLGGK